MQKGARTMPATVGNDHIQCALFLLSPSGMPERPGESIYTEAVTSKLDALSILLKGPCMMKTYGGMICLQYRCYMLQIFA